MTIRAGHAVVAALLAVGACYQDVPLGGGGGGGGDGGPGIDAAAGSACFGHAPMFQFCAATAGALVLDQDIDTDTCMSGDTPGLVVTSAGTTVCAFVADTIQVMGVSASGDALPLVLAARSLLELDGLSASSLRTNAGGPGASSYEVSCLGRVAPKLNGGGAGGAYLSGGGDGGSADGMGGLDEGQSSPAFEAGCAGGGANGSTTVALPGGIVYAISLDTLSGSGTIDADGAGGNGGGAGQSDGFGGNGGGAGGLIALDAPKLELGGLRLVAIGGGGGGGATTTTAGTSADDPSPLKPTPSAPGASANVVMGTTGGGSGSTVATTPGGRGGNGTLGTSGGGGGGGGAGYVITIGAVITAPALSFPEPTVIPPT